MPVFPQSRCRFKTESDDPQGLSLKIRHRGWGLGLVLILGAGCLGQPLHGLRPQAPAAAPTFRAAEEPAPNMPYRVDGVTYYPVENVADYEEKGIASWYGPKFHGKLTSNKEVYDMHSLTAAHKTLPFHTRVRVTNLENGRSLVVRINDRGPFVNNRIIDLSYRAGKRLGMVENGTVPVHLKVIGQSRPAGWTADPPPPKTFTVQVGVFQSRENADRLAAGLRDGRVLPLEQSGQTLYRVVTSAYNTFDRAQERMDALRRSGRRGAFVIAEP